MNRVDFVNFVTLLSTYNIVTLFWEIIMNGYLVFKAILQSTFYRQCKVRESK